MPQLGEDDELIDEYDGQLTSYKQNQFTVEKRGYKINEGGGGMRQPLNSSEMFNAFSNDFQRENRTTTGYMATSSSKGGDFTPIHMGMKENHQRVLSQSYMGNFKAINSLNTNTSNRVTLNKNSLNYSQQQNQQQHLQNQDNNNFNNYNNNKNSNNSFSKSSGGVYGIKDNYSKKPQIQNFFVPQQTNALDDINELNCDQEYYMTEQDYDGHDDEDNLNYNDQNHHHRNNHDNDQLSVEDEELISQQQYKQQKQNQQKRLNQDEYQYILDQDDYNHQHHQEQEDEFNPDQKHYNDDNSQEGNIPISSKSASPDEKIYQKNSITYQTDYLSNHLDSNEEEFRQSNIGRTSNQTDKSDLPFNSHTNNVVVERNDRFIIFKMVPQVNQSTMQNQLKDQPTPALGERHFEYNKAFRETVEDMQSDSDDQQEELTKQKYAVLGFNHPTTKLPTVDSRIDESLFDETKMMQHEIRSVKNQLGTAQPSLQPGIKNNKPPMGKQTSPTFIVTQSIQNNKKGPNAGNGANSYHRGQTQKNFDTSLEEFKIKYAQQQQQDQKDLSLSKSITAYSQSSSDKFSRLQKLEKKNLQEENPVAVDFTMTKNNLNMFIKQQQQADMILLQAEEIVETVKINERRQSDSAVIVRNSLLLQQQQMQQQNLDNKNQMNLSTNNTNINTAQSLIQNDSQQVEDSDQLIMEYKKLKQIMKQMKNEPSQKTQRQVLTSAKNTQQNIHQQNQVSNQKLASQRSQNKSKQNLKQKQNNFQQKLNQQDPIPHFKSNLMSQYNSEDENDVQIKGHKSQIHTAQQSSKAREGKNKNFFKEQQFDKNKTQNKKGLNQNKQSQRQSPIRDKRQKQKNQSKKRNYNSDEDLEEECNQESTPDNSYYKQKRKKNKSLAIRQMRHQKDFLSYDSQNHNHTPQEEISNYYSYSNDNSRSQYDNQRNNKTYQGNSQNESYNQSYDDEEDRNNGNSDSDSERYSDSRSQETSRNSSESSRRQNKKQKRKKDNNSKKNKRVTKTYTQGDRKLKIIMHGGQFSKSNQEGKINQQDFIEKQRQLLQQQYMMQLAQIPQQQMLIQQQLAIQQQLLMQPQIQQQSFFNTPNIQQNINLSSQQIQQQQLQQLDFSNNQPLKQQQQQMQSQYPSQSNNITNYNNNNNFQAQNEEMQGLKRNLSNKNFIQPVIKTQRDLFRDNVSPRRDFDRQTNNNFYPQNNNFLQIRSPREDMKYNDNQMRGNNWNDQNNNNYLDQLKNRFKTGVGFGPGGVEPYHLQGASNMKDNRDPRDYRIDEEYFNPQSATTSSRNNYIPQNNSSPMTGHNRDRQQNNINNKGGVYDKKFQENYNKFEDQRNYPINNQFTETYENRHLRANSFLNQQQQLQRNQMRQTEIHSHNDEDQFELIRMKYRPTEDKFLNLNSMNDDFNHPLPRLEHKITGDFGFKERYSQRPANKVDIFEHQRERNNTSSPSPTGQGDQSMDEGVKASTTRQTMQKSPKTVNQDFSALSVKKPLFNKNSEQKQSTQNNNAQFPRESDRLSNTKTIKINLLPTQKEVKPEVQKTEQDKKGPQALWIGFDDETADPQQQKDLFSNKPQLKNREKAKEQILRSKSTKGTTPSIKYKASMNLQQRKSPLGKEDQQLKSPSSKDALAFSITPNATTSTHQQQPQFNRKPYKLNTKNSNNSNLPDTNHQQNKIQESPLKKAVNEIKNDKILAQQDNQKINQKQQQQLIIIDNDEDFVPGHNKGIAIEIFDKKNTKSNNKNAQQKELSLAEMFKAKKKDAALNSNTNNNNHKKQDQDQNEQAPSSIFQYQQQDKPVVKKEKTKEELAELRKAMMKSKVKRKEDNFSGGTPLDGQTILNPNDQESKQQPKKDPKQDLMIRLAMGQKVQVDKKEMKKLTNKNYSNLPEIKKKKEEEKKKQENAARKAAAAEYMKQLNEKRKLMLKKKKSVVNEED